MTERGRKPKNIGHPLNTDQDEHGLIVSADGHTAYFASAVTKVPVIWTSSGSNCPRKCARMTSSW
jgi:hypothetical protein